jgi:hypothetical protein
MKTSRITSPLGSSRDLKKWAPPVHQARHRCRLVEGPQVRIPNPQVADVCWIHAALLWEFVESPDPQTICFGRLRVIRVFKGKMKPSDGNSNFFVLWIESAPQLT